MFLTAFGFGDGGGGPTRQHIEFVRRAADCDGLPRTRCSRVDDFLGTLARDGHDLATWCGEVFLELHRGTYTTQAANKRANRRSERMLHDAEFFAVAAGAAGEPGLAGYPAQELDSAWKTLLLNQFHDLIPGSSIQWVYEDSHEQYAQVQDTLMTLQGKALGGWSRHIDTGAAQNPVLVFNTLSWDSADLIEIPISELGLGSSEPGAQNAVLPQSLRDSQGRVISPLQRVDSANGAGVLARVSHVPPLGYAVFDLSPDAAPLNPTEAVSGGVSPDSQSPLPGPRAILENRMLRVEIDSAGRVTRLFDKLARREIVDSARPANQFVLYDDRPNEWNAWDIDLFYLESGAARRYTGADYAGGEWAAAGGGSN